MTNILKEYSLKELEDISKNYQLVCVQTDTGKKVISWTPSTKPIEKHFKECVKRVQLEINPEGFYYFCFAQNRRDANNNFDKYLFKKGNPKAEILHHPVNTNNVTEKNILSVQSALDYIQTIAELKSKVLSLETELKQVKDENAVLEAELAEAEREEGLSEGKGSDTLNYLKETTPTFLSAIDRYFEQRDRALSIEEKKLEQKPVISGTLKKFTRPTAKRPEVVTGSEEHLTLIRNLYKDNKEALLNDELDLLEKEQPETYNKICVELNLFEDDTNDKK